MSDDYWQQSPMKARHDNTLKPMARLIYIDLLNMSRLKGYCWATNKTIAKTYDLKSATVSRLINELVSAGYIQVHIDKENGNTRKIIILKDKKLAKEPIDKLTETIDNIIDTIDKKADTYEQNNIDLPVKKQIPTHKKEDSPKSVKVVSIKEADTEKEPNYINELDNRIRSSELEKDSVSVDTAPSKKSRVKKYDDQGVHIDTEYRTNQYMDLISKWNELTGQQQVFNKKKFGYFCNRINNEGHTFEDYYDAMMNYAQCTWHAPKQAWRFGKMFDDDTFIGEYVNKFPRKPLSESDQSILRVKAMRDKMKQEAK